MDFKHIKPFIVAVIGCGLLIEPFYHNNEEKQKQIYNNNIYSYYKDKNDTISFKIKHQTLFDLRIKLLRLNGTQHSLLSPHMH